MRATIPLDSRQGRLGGAWHVQPAKTRVCGRPTLVPYAMACSLWKVPVLPVKPWQITLVCLKTAGGGTLACEPEAQRRVLSAGREVDACVLAAPRTDICLENCRSANAPCLFAASIG